MTVRDGRRAPGGLEAEVMAVPQFAASLDEADTAILWRLLADTQRRLS